MTKCLDFESSQFFHFSPLVCILQLGIQYYRISFFNIGKSIGNNRPVLTPDHDDQLLTGNIQILDLLTNPFIFLFHNDFFQIDIFLTVIMLCSDDKCVIFHQNRITVRNQGLSVPDNHNQNNLRWKSNLFYLFPAP